MSAHSPALATALDAIDRLARLESEHDDAVRAALDAARDAISERRYKIELGEEQIAARAHAGELDMAVAAQLIDIMRQRREQLRGDLAEIDRQRYLWSRRRVPLCYSESQIEAMDAAADAGRPVDGWPL